MPKSPRSRKVARALLKNFPLPHPGSDGDKEVRGRVLVIGGEVSLPGAVVLAGIAALRAGAGKLQIATCSTIAPAIGVAVPESLSLGLRETRDGTIAPRLTKDLRTRVTETDALLIGPGMTGLKSNAKLVASLLKIETTASIVLDAGALTGFQGSANTPSFRNANAVITPHFGEMASLLDIDESEVEARQLEIALETACDLGVVVALKGANTCIATPEGNTFLYESGDVGLATSGSGDTLAGILAGLLARGANPLTATLWAVFLHGEAGNILAKRMGRIGYLARELLDEIPMLLSSN